MIKHLAVMNKRIENPKPLLTVLLTTYNQVDFVEEALSSLFCQDYNNLEIIISDDASDDGTFDLITTMCANYVGRHKVLTNRNEINLGVAGNLWKVFAMACGELMIIADGDDVSLPNRVSLIYDRWSSYQNRPSLICSNAYIYLGNNHQLNLKFHLDI